MNEVFRAAAELQSVCQAHDWRFCFIGGLALQCWGQARETVDADLTLMVGFGGEEPYVQTLLGQFEARVRDPAQFARENRVLLLRAKNGVGLDVALGALPFETSMIERSVLFEFPLAVSLRICSAEDLVVMKALAGRSQDWADVEGIIVRQADRLDWIYIREQLLPLAELKDSPEILDQLESRRKTFEG